MEIEDVEDLKVLPGVKALLESLPPERWTIVTSATRRLLLGRLKRAGLPVPERIISADDVERGKPDPEPYMQGAACWALRRRIVWWWRMLRRAWGLGVAAGCRVLGVWGRMRRRSWTERIGLLRRSKV